MPTRKTIQDMYEAATGKRPDGGEQWKAFYRATLERDTTIKNDAFDKAADAAGAFKPIDPKHMKPTFREGFTTATTGIVMAIFGLKSKR